MSKMEYPSVDEQSSHFDNALKDTEINLADARYYAKQHLAASEIIEESRDFAAKKYSHVKGTSRDLGYAVKVTNVSSANSSYREIESVCKESPVIAGICEQEDGSFLQKLVQTLVSFRRLQLDPANVSGFSWRKNTKLSFTSSKDRARFKHIAEQIAIQLTIASRTAEIPVNALCNSVLRGEKEAYFALSRVAQRKLAHKTYKAFLNDDLESIDRLRLSGTSLEATCLYALQIEDYQVAHRILRFGINWHDVFLLGARQGRIDPLKSALTSKNEFRIDEQEALYALCEDVNRRFFHKKGIFLETLDLLLQHGASLLKDDYRAVLLALPQCPVEVLYDIILRIPENQRSVVAEAVCNALGDTKINREFWYRHEKYRMLFSPECKLSLERPELLERLIEPPHFENIKKLIENLGYNKKLDTEIRQLVDEAISRSSYDIDGCSEIAGLLGESVAEEKYVQCIIRNTERSGVDARTIDQLEETGVNLQDYPDFLLSTYAGYSFQAEENILAVSEPNRIPDSPDIQQEMLQALYENRSKGIPQAVKKLYLHGTLDPYVDVDLSRLVACEISQKNSLYLSGLITLLRFPGTKASYWTEKKEVLPGYLDPNIPPHKNWFFQLAVETYDVITSLAPYENCLEGYYGRLFDQVMTNNIRRFHEEGIGWRQQTEGTRKRTASRIQDVRDICSEFTDSVLVPEFCHRLTLRDSSAKEALRMLSSKKAKKISEVLYPLASQLLFGNKSIGDIHRFNTLWHRLDMRMPLNAVKIRRDIEWRSAFSPTKLGGKYSVECITTSSRLVLEGEALSHCVGGRSYQNSCARGTHIIVSLTHDSHPVATGQFRVLKDGVNDHREDAIPLKNGDALVQNQVSAYENQELSGEIEKRWSQFLDLVRCGKIEVQTDNLGETANSKTRKSEQNIRALEDVSGTPIGERPEGAIRHYESLTLYRTNQKKSSNTAIGTLLTPGGLDTFSFPGEITSGLRIPRKPLSIPTEL